MQKLTTFLLNPVLVKEIRGRMRTWKTLMIIMAYLVIIGGITLAFILMSGGNDVYVNPGRSQEIFIMLSILQLVLIGFVTPGLSAGVISGERERQTLNILLTTQLSPTKIVLSKFMSSLSFMVLLVFSTLPIYAIVVLYGGVGPKQVVAIFGYYLMSIVLFGAVGIFCSSWFKRTGVATVFAYGITFFILGGTGLIALFVHTALQYLNQAGMVATTSFPSVFYLMALNPVVNVAGLFMPELLLPGTSAISAVQAYPMAPWLYFLMVYVPFTALLLYLSVRNLSPVKRPLFRRKRKQSSETKEVTVK